MCRFLNFSNIYLILISLYLLQGVLYSGGTPLSKLIVILFITQSLMYALYTNIRYHLPQYFKGLNILLILFSIYGIWYIFTSNGDYTWAIGAEVAPYTYLLSIYISLLPIYGFYVMTIQGKLGFKKIQLIGIIFLVFCTIKFLKFQIDRINLLGVDEITNNMGYLFVGFLPLIMYYKYKPILLYILLFFCTGMVILSMKRGAILTAAICIIPMIFELWRQGKRKTRISIIFLGILFVIVGIYFIQHLLSTSEYFVERIQATAEGNSSSRDVLLNDMWNYYIQKASLTEQLFGGGANHTIRVADNYAHNDWMEILINQGILGVFIYLIYWILFLTSYIHTTDTPMKLERGSILIVLIASFLMTFFSMSYASLPICMTMALGISFGRTSILNIKNAYDNA